ncbi:hypothetical protein CKO28_25900 [Rhodovibrio sodomensis]|uniref:PepSY domain-containing protein n=1 Tax=Rhodovibrio sodomensis TaxID=1088 RepID=A0ABS1DNZ4_9PROT|nr:hypothetical protein [Rhodovibrio sodomensis]MBK1671438.1 hypothetical protein [Rhodovibrio sodomensis]
MAKQDGNTRALKGLVIGMGVLIVVGLTIVVVTIAMRLSGPEAADGQAAQAGSSATSATTATTARPAARPSGAQPFGALQLGMADSCRIADAVASGGTLVVRVEGPAQDGCGQLVVVDPAQGRVLGRIRPGAGGASNRAGGEP